MSIRQLMCEKEGCDGREFETISVKKKEPQSNILNHDKVTRTVKCEKCGYIFSYDNLSDEAKNSGRYW